MNGGVTATPGRLWERRTGTPGGIFQRESGHCLGHSASCDHLFHRADGAERVFEPSLQSSRTWWRNPGLFTDICYLLVVPFIAPYMRMGLVVTSAVLLSVRVVPVGFKVTPTYGRPHDANPVKTT